VVQDTKWGVLWWYDGSAWHASGGRIAGSVYQDGSAILNGWSTFNWPATITDPFGLWSGSGFNCPIAGWYDYELNVSINAGAGYGYAFDLSSMASGYSGGVGQGYARCAELVTNNGPGSLHGGAHIWLPAGWVYLWGYGSAVSSTRGGTAPYISWASCSFTGS
jgi:hypothetical protein